MESETADITHCMDVLVDTITALHEECEDYPSMFTDLEAKTIYELVVVLSAAFDEYEGDYFDEE